MTNDIVITGLGAYTHFGEGTAALAEALERPTPLSGPAAFEVRRHPEFRHLSRSAAALAIASEEAWRNARLPDRAVDGERAALLEGSSLGPLPDALDAVRSTRRIRPTDLLRFMPGSGGACFAQRHGIQGSVASVSAASVSGALAIVDAVRLIHSGTADLVVVSAVDRPAQDDIIRRFEAAGILASNGCRPYAEDRTGTALADAAGALIIESAAHANQRGAPVHARLLAAEIATEMFGDATPDPTGEGVARAVGKLLTVIGRARIGWIKGHGTGTRKGDAGECAGLHRVFGERLGAIPLTGLKGVLGHSLGASGLVECVACILAARRGFLPGTCVAAAVDPTLPKLDLVARERRLDGHRAGLLLSQSFGGRCVALAVSVWPS